MFSNDEIARYYDLSESHYRLFWNLDESHSLHYGYWLPSTINFHEALVNINKVLSSLADIRQDMAVLDAGCGVGGSSVWLAKTIGCSVTGISLSRRQVEHAGALAAKAGVAGRAVFEQKDFTDTKYPANTFDVVWAIESVCHASDKRKFLAEAYHVLKPGGCLVLADFFKIPGLQGEEAALIQKWAHGWAVPDFSTVPDFKKQLEEAGFSEPEMADATEAIVPSARRLYRAYFFGLAGAWLYRLFKPGATRTGKDNVNTAYLQFKGLKQGLWQYMIIHAVKK